MALFSKSNNNGTNGDNSNNNYNQNDYSNFNGFNEVSDTDTNDELSFTPRINMPGARANSVGMNPRAIASGASDFVRSGGLNKAADFANKLRQGDVAGAAKVYGFNEVADLAEQLQSSGIGIDILTNRDMQPPSPVRGTQGGGSHYNDGSHRLTIDPTPTEVRLNTGIKPDCYTPDYQNAELTYASPLHVSNCQLSIPASSSASLAGQFYNDAVLFDLRNAIQRNITFSTSVTTAQLYTAIDSMLYALQQYYAITRFLVWGDKSRFNDNEGLLFIRGTITSSIGDTYLSLRRLLMGLPIPPNLNKLVFYLFQIYLSSDVPGAPAIMIAPNYFNSGTPDWAELSTAITKIKASIDVYSIIGRAIPSWYGTELLTGIENPLHDDNFTTIWTNLPHAGSGTAPSTYSFFGPSASGNDAVIRYNSWTNNLDGGAYALTGIYDSSTATYIPSLFQPIKSSFNSGANNTSRFSWYIQSTTRAFYDSYLYDSLAFGRDETYTTTNLYGSGSNNCLQFGSQRVWSVTARSVTNCTYQLIDWMLSWDTITSRTDRNLENQGPLDNTKGKRHPGSSKSGQKGKRPRKRGK